MKCIYKSIHLHVTETRIWQSPQKLLFSLNKHECSHSGENAIQFVLQSKKMLSLTNRCSLCNTLRCLPHATKNITRNAFKKNHSTSKRRLLQVRNTYSKKAFPYVIKPFTNSHLLKYFCADCQSTFKIMCSWFPVRYNDSPSCTHE